MNDAAVKAAAKAAVLMHTVNQRLEQVRRETIERGDRGDGPIPFVIIVMASIAGALLIAGGLTLLYGKYAGKLTGP